LTCRRSSGIVSLWLTSLKDVRTGKRSDLVNEKMPKASPLFLELIHEMLGGIQSGLLVVW
jgi:hypothetical protein